MCYKGRIARCKLAIVRKSLFSQNRNFISQNCDFYLQVRLYCSELRLYISQLQLYFSEWWRYFSQLRLYFSELQIYFSQFWLHISQLWNKKCHNNFFIIIQWRKQACIAKCSHWAKKKIVVFLSSFMPYLLCLYLSLCLKQGLFSTSRFRKKLGDNFSCRCLAETHFILIISFRT